MNGRQWTSDEAELVKRYYPTYGPNVDLWPEAPAGRTKNAVGRYANRNGIVLRKTCCLTTEEQQGKLIKAWRLIAGHLGVDARELVNDLCCLRRRGML